MKTIYFPIKGGENTQETLELIKKHTQERNIDTVVIASTKGNSALAAANILKSDDIKLIIVTHMDGFREDGNEFVNELKTEILEIRPNTIFYTGTHAFAGLERSFRRAHDTILPIEMIAIVLRKCFGEGTKVCLEMAIMVSDAGLVDPSSDIICAAGTGRGLDTAWIVQPSYSNKLFDLKMKAPICKPFEF